MKAQPTHLSPLLLLQSSWSFSSNLFVIFGMFMLQAQKCLWPFLVSPFSLGTGQGMGGKHAWGRGVQRYFKLTPMASILCTGLDFGKKICSERKTKQNNVVLWSAPLTRVSPKQKEQDKS